MITATVRRLLIVAAVAAAALSLVSCHFLSGASRNIGFSESYEISRWHHQHLSRASRILVVANAIEKDVAVAEFSTVIAIELSQYFAQATAWEAPAAESEALHRASQTKSDFLFYLSRVEVNKTEEVPAGGVPLYSRVSLIMSVVDVKSRQTIDKINVTAYPVTFPYSAQPLSLLLNLSMNALGKELTGI